jgi:hypothetical protein
MYACGRSVAIGCTPRRPTGEESRTPVRLHVGANDVLPRGQAPAQARTRAVHRGAAGGQWLPATWRRLEPPRPRFVRRQGANVSMTSTPLVFLFL